MTSSESTTKPFKARVLFAPRHLSPAAAVLSALGRRLACGSLSLRLPDGDGLVLGGIDPGPEARVEVHSWRALLRIFLKQGIGFAEGYAAGDWDSPDPAAVVELAARNLDRGVKGPSAALLPRPWHALRHALNANTRRGSRRNISFHYDLGNEFYALWLDPGLTYSSALFAGGETELSAAQDAKYRRILDSLRTSPGQHILEIGCGWGGLAEIAARDYGLRVRAITLSRAQFDHARTRLARAGLLDRVDLRLCDYRDVAGRFDHVVSIEMLEAVGEAYWPLYFRRIGDVLKPGGRAAIQVITIDDALFSRYRRRPDFIQQQVFPGGMLPTANIVAQTAAAAGLALESDFRFGRDYARTLADWRRRFVAAGPEIAALGHDEKFRRRWSFYLAYCEGGFRSGRIDVRQMLFHNPGARS